MERFNPQSVFEATNSDLSPEELKNKIRLLEVKLEKIRQEETILRLTLLYCVVMYGLVF